jgi:hypothetical protein
LPKHLQNFPKVMVAIHQTLCNTLSISILDNSTEKRVAMKTATKASRETKLAAIILKEYQEQWREYEAQCEEYSKQGYRPHYCFHGRNMWIDHDIACGMCEEYGYHYSYQTYARLSIDQAKYAWSVVDDRIGLYVKLNTEQAPIDSDKFILWVMEPVTKLGWTK